MSKTVKRIIVISIILVVVLLIAWPRMDFLKAKDKRKETATTGKAPAGGMGGSVAVDVVIVKAEKLDNKICELECQN